MNTSGMTILFLVVLSTTLLIGISSKIVLAKREVDRNENILPTIEKRPFCNAFTGCGRKRSFGYVDSSDSADPMIQLIKRIIQEAKQWEMFQQRLSHNEVPSATSVLDYLSNRKKRNVSDKS